MEHPIPDSLTHLFSARDSDEFERAWKAFLEEYSSLLLRIARRTVADHDGAMDRYVFVIDALRRDRCQRLQGWEPRGHGRFETWLIVVVRRLCFDFHRQRYGRKQSEDPGAELRHLERRNLTDLVGNEFDLQALTTEAHDAPDTALRRAELRAALDHAMASLDPADRLLLRFRFEDGLSVPEIARARGEPSPFVVYRRLDKVLGSLRRSLERSGILGPSP